jgi:hypothetical protein
MNKGLSERLKSAFTNVIPVTRPQVPKATLNSNTPPGPLTPPPGGGS